jgi:hypothetical protein
MHLAAEMVAFFVYTFLRMDDGAAVTFSPSIRGGTLCSVPTPDGSTSVRLGVA